MNNNAYIIGYSIYDNIVTLPSIGQKKHGLIRNSPKFKILQIIIYVSVHSWALVGVL